MITLQQDADGFVRMNRHFPGKTPIIILFTDGSTGEYTGARLNGLYDLALATFRAENRLDAKGFSRSPAKTVHATNNVEFVPVTAGMAP
ncbi:hypothetical protein BJQ94_04120 [Cryobacterium sp. SO2]|uniref:hypothetical protein n=1 Tax=Cryobacterium sp. SO2 TaxID=1897060 RepID=UPI00223DDF8F|nr:hypothetical protein [Cryobacterium sp. SO2]WEO78232.1 hypothetical protein BJQ94_04120 [Cryobacterium sp. SO2]